MENSFDAFDRKVRESTFSLEARYALADWSKIPLNPTLFAEYKFGIGPLNEIAELGSQPKDEGGDQGPKRTPDAYELRLLLAEDFCEKLEWAFNAFLEQEVGGDRGREWGFAQSLVVPLLRDQEKLKCGMELQYRNHTNHGERGNPNEQFQIGPNLAFKPTRYTRIDVTPLFGITHDAPRLQLFAIISVVLGPTQGTSESEAPASTRNR
jgi:hypothetical protein